VNPDQRDTFHTGKGDACNPDIDGDGIPNAQDPCPYDPSNTPGSALCQEKDDPDKDGIPTPVDNCPGVYNPDQADLNHDGIGDACDSDMDGDRVANSLDNCPHVANVDQKDGDRDGIGDACDDRFCYVVFAPGTSQKDKDLNNCADPNLTFSVLTYPKDSTPVGDPYQLHIFANRENAAMRYTWTIISGPSGNHSHILNPRGSVTYSTPYEYHYLKDQVAQFVGDTPGKYTVQLSAELVFPDAAFPTNNTSRTQFDLTVEDNGKSSGCVCTTPNAQKGGAVLGLMLVGVIFAARGRRRTSK
jgi:MYXO-CTERM domain-containing protein